MFAVSKVIDYATGKDLPSTPEEVYRQEFEHILIDDLGYPKKHISIEYNIQRGSKRDAEKADIVVFKSEKHSQDNIYIIIEIKVPGKQYDMQALSYATATPASYVVWFSGLERSSEQPRYLYRDLKADATKFIDIPSLPRFGETQETIGKYRKNDLKPAKALKLLFARIHYRLYGSAPIKREEDVAKEIIKLLFCKIYDELSPNELCEFRAVPSELASEEGQKRVKQRVEALFNELLQDPDLGEMFVGETLNYDAYWVSYIVSELQGVGLLHPDTNTDALGDAYEILLPSTLKGESGQFFTPREVVGYLLVTVSRIYKYYFFHHP